MTQKTIHFLRIIAFTFTTMMAEIIRHQNVKHFRDKVLLAADRHFGAGVTVRASFSRQCQLHSSFSLLSSMSSSPSLISYKQKHQFKVPKDNRSYSCLSYISSCSPLSFINLTITRKLSRSPLTLSSSFCPLLLSDRQN